MEVSGEDYLALHQAARRVAHVLDAAFDDVARTGIMYEGYGIDHAYAKLFPMHGTAGNNGQSWRPIHSDIGTFFDSYRGYLSSHDAARADDAGLARLAEHIRACRP